MIRLCAFSDEAGKELSTQISAMQENGIFLTELRSVEGKNVKKLTLSEAKEIRNTLRAEGIATWAVGSPIGKVPITVEISEYLEELRHVCALANTLETDRIRMFSFHDAYGERDRVIEYLCRMVEVAAEFGVLLCHENEKNIYGDTAERVADLMENVKGMRFVYDPANYLQVGEPSEKTLPRFAAVSDYFHIKDVISATEELVPAGYGDGNLRGLVQSIDRDCTLTLEPHLKVFEAYAQIDGEKMNHRFHFDSNRAAFDAAANALKDILRKEGYKETEGAWVK